MIGGGSLFARRVKLRLNRLGMRNAISFRVLEEFGEETDELWEEAKSLAPIQLSRDREFISWRYANAPENRYIILGAYEDQRMVGYTVLRRVEGELAIGYIVDLVARGDDPELAGSLLTAAEEVFCRLHCDLATAWILEHDALREIAKKLEFRPSGDPIRMLYRLSNQAIDDSMFGDPQNWRVCLGCSDGC
jgi:hypothetical protein